MCRSGVKQVRGGEGVCRSGVKQVCVWGGVDRV